MRSLAQLLLTVLLNASWQIAVVTLFAICCSWLLRGTAAWCRHSVWVAAIVISLCLPIISGLNALESSPVPKQPKQNLTLIESEQSVTSPASLQEIALTVPAIAPVQMAKVGPARQAGWISPISLNRNLAAVLVAFYAFFLVYKAKDVAAVMALRTDDFHTITPDGKVNARADMEAYTQRFLKRIDHFISEDFQLGTIEVQGDLASADVTQNTVRMQRFPGGTLHKVEAGVVQRETWKKTTEGWKMYRVDNIRDPSLFVDDKPYKPTQ